MRFVALVALVALVTVVSLIAQFLRQVFPICSETETIVDVVAVEPGSLSNALEPQPRLKKPCVLPTPVQTMSPRLHVNLDDLPEGCQLRH